MTGKPMREPTINLCRRVMRIFEMEESKAAEEYSYCPIT